MDRKALKPKGQWAYLPGAAVCEHGSAPARCLPCAVLAERARVLMLIDDLLLSDEWDLCALRRAVERGEGVTD